MKNIWIKLGGLLGIAYCVAGFFLVFLGWNGAASNDREAAQLPYLVSGGIAGLGLVVLGSALIVAHSLRADRVELRGSIDALRAAIERSTSGPDAPAGDATVTGAARSHRGPSGSASGSGSASADVVVAGPQSYHRPDCTIVAGQVDVAPMSRVAAADSARIPCRVCTPDAA